MLFACFCLLFSFALLLALWQGLGVTSIQNCIQEMCKLPGEQ